MSSDEIAEFVSAYDAVEMQTRVGFASIAFFLYDYMITLDGEIKFFWKSRLSAASVLFFVIRYSWFVSILLSLAERGQQSNESCNILYHLGGAIQYAQYLPLAVFSGMRAYALCKNGSISGLITALSLAPLVVNFVDYGISYQPSVLPIFGCSVIETVTLEDNIIFAITSRGSLILADALLVAMTWRTLGRGSFAADFAKDRSMTFSSILLWNGTIYFASLFILNVLHLTFTLTAIFSPMPFTASNLTLFTEPLTTALTYRFILDLQEANHKNVKINSDDPLHSSTSSHGSLNFARVIGSIGSIIVPDATSDAEDEDDQPDRPDANTDRQGGSSGSEIPLDSDPSEPEIQEVIWNDEHRVEVV